MKNPQKEVWHISKLSRIPINEKMVKKLSFWLKETVDYVRILENVGLSGVPRTFQVTGLRNIFRDDTAFVSKSTLGQKEALANAPEKRKGMFIVKRVVKKQ